LSSCYSLVFADIRLSAQVIEDKRLVEVKLRQSASDSSCFLDLTGETESVLGRRLRPINLGIAAN
jgi:hypothetical protein